MKHKVLMREQNIEMSCLFLAILEGTRVFKNETHGSHIREEN
jgi:hypothetical protein